MSGVAYRDGFLVAGDINAPGAAQPNGTLQRFVYAQVANSGGMTRRQLEEMALGKNLLAVIDRLVSKGCIEHRQGTPPTADDAPDDAEDALAKATAEFMHSLAQ